MTGRSTTLLLTSAALLAVCSAVVLHNSFAPRSDTCANPFALRSMAIFEGARNLAVHVDQVHDQPLWVDGTLGNTSVVDDAFLFRFIRSYDVARFLQSGLLLLRNFPLPGDRSELRILDVDGQAVPMRLRSRQTGNAPFVTGYVFAIGNVPVANPLWGALRQVFDRPLSGPKPITILLIESPRTDSDFSRQETRIVDWLTAGWREFRAHCVPSRDVSKAQAAASRDPAHEVGYPPRAIATRDQ